MEILLFLYQLFPEMKKFLNGFNIYKKKKVLNSLYIERF